MGDLEIKSKKTNADYRRFTARFFGRFLVLSKQIRRITPTMT